MSYLADWPLWARALLWTVSAISIAYGIGRILRILVGPWLTRLVARSPGDWDDALVGELRRRVPFWCVLAGIYLALPVWALDPPVHTWIVRVVSAFAVASVTLALAVIATRLVSSFGPRASPDAPVSALTQNVVRVVVILLGVLVIFGSFGWNITPYLTALGVGGLAVALALQDPLSNFFAGVFMSVSGQLRIGDYVRLDSGAEGHIEDFNWRATSIRALANNLVIVPNTKLAQAIVTNYSQPSDEIGMTVEVGVHYQSDLAMVERVTGEVARLVMREVDGGVQDAEPLVRFHTFGPTGVACSVVMRARQFTDQGLLKHELLKRLHVRYAAEGIVIPVLPLSTDPRPSADSGHGGRQA